MGTPMGFFLRQVAETIAPSNHENERKIARGEKPTEASCIFVTPKESGAVMAKAAAEATLPHSRIERADRMNSAVKVLNAKRAGRRPTLQREKIESRAGRAHILQSHRRAMFEYAGNSQRQKDSEHTSSLGIHYHQLLSIQLNLGAIYREPEHGPLA